MATKMNISIIGAGTMGIGIAHATAQKNHKTVIYDTSSSSLKNGKEKLYKLLDRKIFTRSI